MFPVVLAEPCVANHLRDYRCSLPPPHAQIKQEAATARTGFWQTAGLAARAYRTIAMIQRTSLALLLLLSIVGPGAAQSPDADIDAVQRKLDAAKQAQAAKDAAAKREADQRAARAASAAAAQANMGTLIVRSDHDCSLSIDGTVQQDIGPTTTATLKVAPGDQLIECVSKRFPDTVRHQQVKPLSAGSKSVVLIELEAQSAELDRAERVRNRFVAQGSTVEDNQTGLTWAAQDNGSDIDWNGARNYCASLGVGWTLPTVAQLQALYGSSGVQTQSCGQWTCKVTPLIRLSSLSFWSGESSGSSEAWSVALSSGFRVSGSVGYALTGRALCVRRS
jgi:hypothetical protein